MKMSVAVAVMIVLALSSAGAMAFDNDWLAYVRVSTEATARTGMSTAMFGWKTAAGDTFAPLTPPAALGTFPEIEYADATHPYTSDYSNVSQKRWFVAKIAGLAPKQSTWTFRAAGAEYASIYVTAWNQSGAANAIDTNPGFALKLYESNAAGERLGDPIWWFRPGVTTTYSGTTGIAGTANVDYFQKAYTLGATDSAGGAYQYFVLAIVPEPGSLAAKLALLGGFAGLVVRRRQG
jgi:hypothetical protein